MLTITVPESEAWDEQKNLFIHIKSQTIRLEHSLVSISKWESKWHKSFLSDGMKTNEEVLDYIRCMTITQNVDPNVYHCLSNEIIDRINKYIEDPYSATVFYDKVQPGKPSRERISSEKIYFWMVVNGIPFECQTWHLNRLMNLIRYCNAYNAPAKKRKPHEIAKDYDQMNAARRKQFNTSG